MLPETSNRDIMNFIENDANCYSIKRLYNKNDELSVVQVLDERGRICKCLFYDEGKRLSNVCVYNSDSGKETMNITYRRDGKTISSMREYNSNTNQLLSVTFYKEDGKSPSSIIEYDDYGQEAQFSLFCDDGEIITQVL